MFDLLEEMLNTLEVHNWLVLLLILLTFPATFIAGKIMRYCQFSYPKNMLCLISLASTLGVIGRYVLHKNIIYIILSMSLLTFLSGIASAEEHPIYSSDTSLKEILLVMGMTFGVFFWLYIWFFYVFL